MMHLQKGQRITILLPNPYCKYTGEATIVSDGGKPSILIKDAIAHSFVPYGLPDTSKSYLTYDHCIQPMDITEPFKAKQC